MSTAAAQLQNLKKLVAGRIDVTADDVGVLQWVARQNRLDERIRVAGCLSDETVPAYVVLSRMIPESQTYLDRINAGFAELTASGRVEELLEKYGLTQE